MKKTLKLFVCSLLFFITSFIIVFIISQKMQVSLLTYYGAWDLAIDNFDEYKEDFEAVEKFCENFFILNSEREKDIISVLKTDGEYRLYCNEEYLELPEEIEDSLKTVAEAFKTTDSYLELIRYYDTGIYFDEWTFHYAVVFSFDGSKPKFYHTNDTESKLYVKKIDDHWYHISRY